MKAGFQNNPLLLPEISNHSNVHEFMYNILRKAVAHAKHFSQSRKKHKYPKACSSELPCSSEQTHLCCPDMLS